MINPVKKFVYLDYNATTPVLPEVIEEFRLYAEEMFANPSSPHLFGNLVKEKLEYLRGKVADFIDAESSEVLFTSGGTEANHLAILGYLTTEEAKKKKRVLLSSFEHPSILSLVEKIKNLSFEVELIPVNSRGIVEPDAVKKLIKDDVALVSVMMVNNEIGTVQPIKEIASICKSYGVVVHTDACQAGGKVEVSVKKLGVDLLSLAGHKMYAPKGIGVLFVKKGIKLNPIFTGGGQERGLRAGTEPVPLIAAFAKACELAKRDLPAEAERLIFLREKLYTLLKEIYPRLYRFGIPEATVPNTLTISFVELNALELIRRAERLCVSTGAACHSKTGSTTQKALNTPPEVATGTIRFSLGRYTTLETVEEAALLIKKALSELRS